MPSPGVFGASGFLVDRVIGKVSLVLSLLGPSIVSISAGMSIIRLTIKVNSEVESFGWFTVTLKILCKSIKASIIQGGMIRRSSSFFTISAGIFRSDFAMSSNNKNFATSTLSETSKVMLYLWIKLY